MKIYPCHSFFEKFMHSVSRILEEFTHSVSRILEESMHTASCTVFVVLGLSGDCKVIHDRVQVLESGPDVRVTFPARTHDLVHLGARVTWLGVSVASVQLRQHLAVVHTWSGFKFAPPIDFCS